VDSNRCYREIWGRNLGKERLDNVPFNEESGILLRKNVWWRPESGG
jgi:hypothetical protein